RPDWQPVTGPGVVLSGSCSTATRAQVAGYRQTRPSREITAEEVIAGAIDAKELADWALCQADAPLIYSSAEPEVVRAAQQTHGRARVAAAVEGFFSELATGLVDRGVTRMIVAGGETSGAIVSALGIRECRIGPRLASGVPALRVAGSRPLALALKSGNFGGPDFFAEALASVEGEG
ncbi:MAG: hypothetical protein HC844_21745, partial [Tabrizicola sp.]|nr:hypothetical protein [Tabrizicola sp.]